MARPPVRPLRDLTETIEKLCTRFINSDATSPAYFGGEWKLEKRWCDRLLADIDAAVSCFLLLDGWPGHPPSKQITYIIPILLGAIVLYHIIDTTILYNHIWNRII